jgi:nitroreductase
MSHADPAEQLTLAEPMRSRRSTRILDHSHELADGDLELLLRAAQWAPSWGNLQPWAFVVARRGGPAHAALVPRLSRGNSTWVPSASVVVVTAAQVAPRHDDDGFKGDPYACYDLGPAAAHLSLQATAMGLQAHQFAGFDKEGLAQDLGVPVTFRVMTGIAVGRSGDPARAPERDRERESRPRVRRALPDLVYVDAWGHEWGQG